MEPPIPPKDLPAMGFVLFYAIVYVHSQPSKHDADQLACTSATHIVKDCGMDGTRTTPLVLMCLPELDSVMWDRSTLLESGPLDSSLNMHGHPLHYHPSADAFPRSGSFPRAP